MSQKRSIFIAVFALCANLLSASASTHMYDQLMPQMLKMVNIENPSEQDILLINTCRAHSEGGLQYPLIGTENWQAINSIEIFTRILPAYARNITSSGYIALARQVAQMTDNQNTLEKRIALTQHLKQNPDTVRKLTEILKRAVHSEEFFFHLFRKLDEETQAAQNAVHQQLYFSRSGFTSLNENSAALEVGPRLNQLVTTGLLYYILLTKSLQSYENKITEKRFNYFINRTSTSNLNNLIQSSYPSF